MEVIAILAGLAALLAIGYFAGVSDRGESEDGLMGVFWMIAVLLVSAIVYPMCNGN